jgi:hypothetical protein
MSLTISTNLSPGSSRTSAQSSTHSLGTEFIAGEEPRMLPHWLTLDHAQYFQGTQGGKAWVGLGKTDALLLFLAIVIFLVGVR